MKVICYWLFVILSFSPRQLTSHVFVTAVTLQHIPKVLSPDGTASSAPQEFKVFVCVSDMNLLKVYLFCVFRV